MVTNNTYEYGIKYRVVKIDNDHYFMMPVSLEGGLSDGIVFSTGEENIPIANCKKDLRRKYVMDNVLMTEDLEEIYELYDDTETLSQYFYEEHKNTVYLVKVLENGSLKKYAIDTSKFKEVQYDMTYHMDKSVPMITLNEDCLNEILGTDDIHEMRVLLEKYKELLKSFKEENKKNGVTTIHVKDGKVESFETNKEIESEPKKNTHVDKKKESVVLFGGIEVSYNGLEKELKSKIFGHDKEIELIAQRLYMNYTAQEGETVHSILLVGPTGTGKTETFRAAAEYFYLPFVEANAADLVPQGIVGISINTLVKSLYEQSGRDKKRAERGFIFLDEFDKIANSSLDIKASSKDILLTFNSGGKIIVKDDEYFLVFDSKMTNKGYAGVFDRIYKKDRKLGFGVVEDPDFLGSPEEIKKKIIENKYYTDEEISRINTIIGYGELSRETKKDILLRSKLSEFSKKIARYKRQFDIDLMADESFINAIIDSISNDSVGMRNLNNYVLRVIDNAEREILRNERKGYKKLILTKDTVSDPTKFDLS